MGEGGQDLGRAHRLSSIERDRKKSFMMNRNVIYHRMRRPDAALVARAAACAMSDLYEALGPAAQSKALMSPRMRPVASGVRIAGPALTVRCAPGDNLMM